MKSVIRYRDMMGVVPFKDWLQYPVCASLTCRGCTHDCVTCGGSAYAFREHFGRDKVAFRDPELLVRDIAHIQKLHPGPDLRAQRLPAGRPRLHARVRPRASASIDLKNPIGFEFFKPPHEDFYEFLNENLNDYSVEISVESHDDGVRAAFGKKHYTMDAGRGHVIATRSSNGCSRFDLYFMTGIPSQTADSVRETARVRRGTSTSASATTRGCCAFTSPMAPFLDPGSIVFDNPEEYGYTLRATTLEEHRQLLLAAVVEAHHELRERTR